jgi:hypothetical protein
MAIEASAKVSIRRANFVIVVFSASGRMIAGQSTFGYLLGVNALIAFLMPRYPILLKPSAEASIRGSRVEWVLFCKELVINPLLLVKRIVFMIYLNYQLAEILLTGSIHFIERIRTMINLQAFAYPPMATTNTSPPPINFSR